MIWLTLALLLFIFQIAIILVAEHRHPSRGLAWVAILFMLPLIGFLVYYAMSQQYRRRKLLQSRGREAAKRPPGRLPQRAGGASEPELRGGTRLLGLLRSLPDAAITVCNEAKVYASAKEFYRSMLEDCERARDHIHMIYYIWNDDESGRMFRDCLIRKAQEGVEVRIVYDGIGAYTTPQPFWNELRAAGVQVCCFLPVWAAVLVQRVNYRNHRKITIVDGKIGYVGGINIGDEYLGGDKKLGFWRDTSVRLEGDAALELQRTFFEDWEFVCGEGLSREERFFPRHAVAKRHTVQIVPSGPDTDRSSILETAFGAFCAAQQRIYVTTPYLIPDRSLAMALKTAALAGVDVRVVIPGVADSRVTLWASLSFVEELLRAGVRVYRYRKGFLHAKTVVVDDFFATTGTANMDLRSFFNNFEVNAVFFDREIVARFADDLLQDLADSEELEQAAFGGRGRLQKGKEALGRLLSPLL